MAWCQQSPTQAEFPSRSCPVEFQPEYLDDTPIPGFGIEFEYSLNEAWEKHENKKEGRLERYSRYGMTEEEARRLNVYFNLCNTCILSEEWKFGNILAQIYNGKWEDSLKGLGCVDRNI